MSHVASAPVFVPALALAAAALPAAGGMVRLATQLGALDISARETLALNDYGWIVGPAVATNGGGSRAFLCTQADGMIDLNTLLSNSRDLTLIAATAIGGNGYIAGYGRASDGQEHAFLIAPRRPGAGPPPAARPTLDKPRSAHCSHVSRP